MKDDDVKALGQIIWETSRADESTISYAGANIVAKAILASDWLAGYNASRAEAAEARAAALEAAVRELADVWDRNPQGAIGSDRRCARREAVSMSDQIKPEWVEKAAAAIDAEWMRPEHDCDGIPEACAERCPRSAYQRMGLDELRDAAAHVAADIARQAVADALAPVRELVPDECWITRGTMIRCSGYIGGTFHNGTVWTEGMCCLPCRLRAALRAAVDHSSDQLAVNRRDDSRPEEENR